MALPPYTSRSRFSSVPRRETVAQYLPLGMRKPTRGSVKIWMGSRASYQVAAQPHQMVLANGCGLRLSATFRSRAVGESPVLVRQRLAEPREPGTLTPLPRPRLRSPEGDDSLPTGRGW